jgi:hypothetical protein
VNAPQEEGENLQREVEAKEESEGVLWMCVFVKKVEAEIKLKGEKEYLICLVGSSVP